MEQFSLEKWLKDKSRKVVTRDGRPVRIVCWDAKMECPIMALALNKSNNKELALHYHVDGTYSPLMESDVDLFFADEEVLSEFEKQLGVYIYFSKLSCEFNKEEKKYIRNAANTLLSLARKEIEKENSEFKPKFTYNEKDYSKLANKLIEFRNNTPLCSVSYRDGEGRKIILRYEKEILDLVRKELEANYYTKVLDDRMVFKSQLHATDLKTAYDMGKQDTLKSLPKWKKAKKDEELDCHVAIQQDDRVVLSDFVQKDEYYITLDVLKTLQKEE